jgi:hypothetical protein
VLSIIKPGASDDRLHGALRLLGDLVDDSLNEDTFFNVARDIFSTIYNVVIDENIRLTLRALALSSFKACFEIMDMVKEEHGTEVKTFADEVISQWSPFLHEVMKIQLPQRTLTQSGDLEQEPESWRGIIAFKLQVVKTLVKIRSVFPSLLLAQSPTLFSLTWAELSALAPAYKDMYIDHDEQGRLEDADGLPYTLDFLVLEELDFLQSCLRANPVKEELEKQIQAHGGIAQTPWVIDVMKLAVSYAQITSEEEGLWDIDVNIFLAEETAVTANYTARMACGDLLIKLGEWLHQGALEGLLAYTRVLYTSPEATWRTREAALFLLNQVSNDFLDVDKHIPPVLAAQYIEFIDHALSAQEEVFLRARGYLVASILVQCTEGLDFPSLALFDKTIKAITDDESIIVEVACIKAVQGYIKAPGGVPADRQVPIIQAIAAYLEGQDLTELEESDDLLVTFVESLRAAVAMNFEIAVAPGSNVIDLFFLLARHGASSFQMTMIVQESFEDIVQALSERGADGYVALCEKVLPSITGAFDVGNVTEDDPLTVLACEMLAALCQFTSFLPPGFVAAVMPKLNRLLLNTVEGEVLRPGSEAIKFMLEHGAQQVFDWQDETGKFGLQVVLDIIAKLLGPDMEDNSAAGVGELAAELVEKAGPERLGPFLPELLQAVAARLATAQAAQFIQSLIIVFARLALNSPADVVEFLSQIEIAGQSGLQVVLSKWLEHSVSFAGYDEIRQKYFYSRMSVFGLRADKHSVIALTKVYELNDPRVAQTMVKGELIVPTSSRIMTRSMTKSSR